MSIDNVCSNFNILNDYFKENGNSLFGIRVKQKQTIRFEICKSSFPFKIWTCFQYFCLKIIPLVKSHSQKIDIEINKQLEPLTDKVLKAASKAKLIELKDELIKFEAHAQKKSALMTRLFGCAISYQACKQQPVKLLKERLIEEINLRIDPKSTTEKNTEQPQDQETFDKDKNTNKSSTTNAANFFLKGEKELVKNIVGYLQPNECSSFSVAFKCNLNFHEWVKRSGYYEPDYHLKSFSSPDSFVQNFLKLKNIHSINLLTHSFYTLEQNKKVSFDILSRLFNLENEFPNLKKLFTYISDELTLQMALQLANGIVSSCPNLEIIDIWTKELEVQKVLILGLKKLKHIVFKNEEFLNDEIVELLNDKQSLETIDLSCRPSNYAKYIDFCRRINVFKNVPLTSSYKNSIWFRNYSYEQCFDHLKNLHGIQVVKLEASGGSGWGFPIDNACLSIIESLRFLEEVMLEDFFIPNNVLEKFIEKKSINSFSLGGINVQSNLEILSTSENLKRITVLSSQQSSEIKPIFNSKSLEYLEIYLHTGPFDILLEGIKTCKSLKELKIVYSTVNKLEIQALKKFKEDAFQIRPDLTIYLKFPTGSY